MEGTEMKASLWKADDHNLNNKFFPKWYKFLYDNTASTSGCFQERPGFIFFNMNLADVTNPKNKQDASFNM